MRYPIAPQACKITCYIIMACYNFLCMINPENIKLIASDIDDTLIPGGELSISKRTKEALLSAQRKGIKVLIVTGRHYKYLPKTLFDDLPMDVIGTINGACLTDREGNTIAKFPMSEEVMNTITDIAIKHDLGLGFKFEDAIVTYSNHELFVSRYLRKGLESDSKIIDDTKKRKHHLEFGLPLGMFIVGVEDDVIEEYRKALPDLVFSYSYTRGCDVYLRSVSKVTAVEKVLEMEGLTWNNVIAFGDAANDTPMIQKAGIGVAMGNGKDDVLEVADIVAPDTRNDGVAQVLEELNIA